MSKSPTVNLSDLSDKIETAINEDDPQVFKSLLKLKEGSNENPKINLTELSEQIHNAIDENNPPLLKQLIDEISNQSKYLFEVHGLTRYHSECAKVILDSNLEIENMADLVSPVTVSNKYLLAVSNYSKATESVAFKQYLKVMSKASYEELYTYRAWCEDDQLHIFVSGDINSDEI